MILIHNQLSHPPLLKTSKLHLSLHRNSDMSPLFAIISLIILIIIPTLVYALIYAMKRPQTIFRRSSGDNSGEVKTCHMDTTSIVVKYEKKLSSEENNEDSSNECPVCLTAFVEGEEVRQLMTCKHMFHFNCIDKWLCSKSSCPVCRAAVKVRRPKLPPVVSFDDDFRQGLPDAASLV
ncbi:RING-H2 finger protein ATL33-like [Capsicum galapagoense]